MPHFIERLGDDEEDSCTQSSFLKALRYFVDNPMYLLDRGLAGAKPELVTGMRRERSTSDRRRFRRSRSKTFDGIESKIKKANRVYKQGESRTAHKAY